MIHTPGASPTLLDSYQEKHFDVLKMLWTSLDAELSRFWLRFNVFSTLQFGVAYALITTYGKISSPDAKTEVGYVHLALFLLAIMVIVLSLTTVVMVGRAIAKYECFANAILNVESMCPPHLRITTNFGDVDVFRYPFTMYLVRVLSLVLLFGWWITALFFVNKLC